MTLATIVLAALVGLGNAEDPRQLVQRLGADRFADREAAATALLGLGSAALPDLREAREADDPEVAARATALVDQIESNLMVQPTKVKLDYRDRTLAEIARDLGTKASVEIRLIPEANPLWNTRKLTLEATDPVPLWEAVEELCRAGGFQVSQSAQIVGMGQPGRQMVINLMANGLPPGPADVRGPFRIAVNKVDYQRQRIFNQAASQMGMMIPQNGMIVQPRAVPPRPADAPKAGELPGVAQESFSMELQLLAEPRMLIALDGQMKVVEAVDDKGQSLVPTGAAGVVQTYAGYNGMHPMGTTSLQLPVQLAMPEQPGTLIRRFRATVPVVVLARKEEPLVIPLSEVGKTFKNDDLTLQLHEVKKDANQPFTQVELTARLSDQAQDGPLRQSMGAELMIFRSQPGNGNGQVEVVDARGRPYAQFFPIKAQTGQDGSRMTLQLMPAPDVGPPAEIRFHGMSRASIEVSFELNDVPMP